MQVREILARRRHEVLTIAPERTVQSAAALLAQQGACALVVVDGGRAVRGIFTAHDLVRACAAEPASLGKVRVEEAMAPELMTCQARDHLQAVEALMRERGIHHLPVLEGRALSGVISLSEVLAALYETARDDADDLRDHLAGHYVVC